MKPRRETVRIHLLSIARDEENTYRSHRPKICRKRARSEDQEPPSPVHTCFRPRFILGGSSQIISNAKLDHFSTLSQNPPYSFVRQLSLHRHTRVGFPQLMTNLILSAQRFFLKFQQTVASPRTIFSALIVQHERIVNHTGMWRYRSGTPIHKRLKNFLNFLTKYTDSAFHRTRCFGVALRSVVSDEKERGCDMRSRLSHIALNIPAQRASGCGTVTPGWNTWTGETDRESRGERAHTFPVTLRYKESNPSGEIPVNVNAGSAVR